MRTWLPLLFLLAACSPRNGIQTYAPGDGPPGDDDDDDSAGGDGCDGLGNAWPDPAPEFVDYEGTGVMPGDQLLNFRLRDQFGHRMCLSQLLGMPLIVDASTRWCGPCNKAAAESMELLEILHEIGPASIITLMVQDFTGSPAQPGDVDWWINEYGIEGYPVVLDDDEETADVWQTGGAYPLFFFLEPDGTIQERLSRKPDDSEVIDFVTQIHGG
jgi:thiol-disulfide isomerase/thioredoxin